MSHVSPELTRLPTTDEEAERWLRFHKDELVGASLVGLYRVYRAQGAEMLGAYEKALLTLVYGWTG